MKEAVTRTRETLSERIEEVVSFRKEIDRDTLDDLEATLISADLGTATTTTVLARAARESRSQAGGQCRRAQACAEGRAAGDSQCRQQTAGTESRWRARSDSGCRRKRHRQNHLDRQADASAAGARQDRPAGRSRHLSRRRHRATGDLGRSHRNRSHQEQAGRRSRSCALRRSASGQGAQHRLRHRRHRRPPAHQNQPDG